MAVPESISASAVIFLFKSTLQIQSVIPCMQEHQRSARAMMKVLVAQVLLNGLPLGQTFQRHSAYVPQEDIFVPTLSAWETLQVCACTRAILVSASRAYIYKDHCTAIICLVNGGETVADHTGQQPLLLLVADSGASSSCTRRPAY